MDRSRRACAPRPPVKGPLTALFVAALLAAALLAAALAPAVQGQGLELFGTYDLEGDRYDGAYLAFTRTDRGLADVAFQDLVLLESVGFDVGELTVEGATVRGTGPNGSLELHDVPSAFVKVTAAQATVVGLVPAANTRVEATGAGGVTLFNGVEVGVWSPDGDLVMDSEGNLSAELDEGERLMLRLRPGGTRFPALSAYEADISRAVEQGRVGAEAFVQGGPRPGHAVAVYAAMQVAVETGDDVTLTVDAAGEEAQGRVVVARVDDLALSGQGPVGVLYDGRAIPRADGPADVLDPHDDGLQPEFLVAEVGGAHVVLVSVPHFSEHTILISKAVAFVQEHPEVAVATVVGGVLVVAAAAVGMFKPRKGKGGGLT